MKTKHISRILRMIHRVPDLESGIELPREPLSRRQGAATLPGPITTRALRGEGASDVKRLRQMFVTTAFAVGLGAVAILTGCTRSHAQPKPVPPTVTVATVEQKEIVEWDEFTGRTAPIEFVEVRPRVSGHIQ